jgi:hypothetical protein
MSKQPHNRSNGPKLTKQGAKGSADYQVGHCRPPKQFQFKPGESGNPSGRPKNRLSFTPELADALFQLVADRDNRRITNKCAIVNTIMAEARRNAQYAIALMAHCEKVGGRGVDPSAAEDDAFVERLVGGEPAAAEEIGGSSSTDQGQTEIKGSSTDQEKTEVGRSPPDQDQTKISRSSPDEETEQ